MIDGLLQDGTFSVRAITRNPEGSAAKALQDRGVEVVKGDLEEPASLIPALEGSECVYAVTLPYFNKTSEYEMGKNVVDASKAVGVKFFVWSSLPSASKLSKGKYTQVHHFDQKAAVDGYLATSGVPFATVQTGYYLENAWRLKNLIKTESGYEMRVAVFPPNVPQVFTWVAKDLGPAVTALMTQYNTRPEDIMSQNFVVATARISYQQLADTYSKGLGVPVKLVSLPTTGRQPVDDMLKMESEFGIFNEVQTFPDPKLVKLGVRLEPFENFTEVVKTRL